MNHHKQNRVFLSGNSAHDLTLRMVKSSFPPPLEKVGTGDLKGSSGMDFGHELNWQKNAHDEINVPKSCMAIPSPNQNTSDNCRMGHKNFCCELRLRPFWNQVFKKHVTKSFPILGGQKHK